MRRVWTAAFLLASFFATLPAGAAPIIESIEGTLIANDPLADVGAGTITGSVTFDDATGTPGFVDPLNGEVFIPTALELVFSNGPTLTLGALPIPAVEVVPASIEVDTTTGELLALDWVIFTLGGFSAYDPFSDPIDLNALSSTLPFFTDALGNIVVEGTIAFADEDGQVPVPGTVLLLGVGTGLLAWRRQTRRRAG